MITITNQKLLDLYKIPLDTKSNRIAEMYIRDETKLRTSEAIRKALMLINK